MKTEFLMGNEAIARGAVAAGVNLVAGYPGTPSTEVLETIAKMNDGSIYVEWSVNEKAAMEVAAGASYSGARTLVTMKQVGLNVASDPLMSLEYVGIKGGMVVMVADDPGPISSQTEQDTRTFAMFSKLPCFDPSSPQEAYDMIRTAFEYSEKYGTPVFLRPTTRICHAYSSVDVLEEQDYKINIPEGFKKDASRWVIFPKLSFRNHALIEERNDTISDDFSSLSYNGIIGSGSSLGLAAGGISFSNAMEITGDKSSLQILKVGTPFPFPEKLALSFLEGKKEVLCLEELDPVIERGLISVCGKYGLDVKIRGKMTGDVARSGELSKDAIKDSIGRFTGEDYSEKGADLPESPDLPVRPPVLCAGCPHRASFYAVKKAMKGFETIYAGDIGCYTLGNAQPLDMVDTCLCMGAGVNIAQGVGRIRPDTKCFAFVGDSTFFASAITGVVNAVYNGADMTLVVLDNSTTAMTGHQPHPGTGKTMMGEISNAIDIEAVLRGVGVETVERIDPNDLDNAVKTVKATAMKEGVKAIIFESPCAMLVKPEKPLNVDTDKCIDCRLCIKELGCPGLTVMDGRVRIDDSLCNGCGLCSQVCPVDAIGRGED